MKRFARLCKREPQVHGNRDGSVLLMVLVIVSLMSLAAYTFSEISLSEMKASAMYGRRIQTRTFSESGIEFVLSALGNRAHISLQNLYHNPDLFQNVLVHHSETESGRGRFSIIAPVEQQAAASRVRFGLIDESAKLNLNAVLNHGLDEQQARRMLLGLPGMTHAIADAILDWIDDDDVPRHYGAENEYYTRLPAPYRARNGTLDSLSELLRVRGVTRRLMYGEDANRNGQLDSNENDGDLSPPADDADGALDGGWEAYLSIDSRESNRRSDGTERINLNHHLLTELYDRLAEEFDDDVAKFVTAYRIHGPFKKDETHKSGSGGGVESFATLLRRRGGEASRHGLDLAPDGRFRINSLYDLIDVEVEATIDSTRVVLESPWSADPVEMKHYLPQLTDKLAITSKAFLDGRININQARREVLLGLPGMTAPLVDAITAYQTIETRNRPLVEQFAWRSTTAWLLTEGLVDLEQLRRLDPYITAQGSVFRVQALGYFESGGPVSRLEAVIDATGWQPKIIALRDLPDLECGYPRQFLMPSPDQSSRPKTGNPLAMQTPPR